MRPGDGGTLESVARTDRLIGRRVIHVEQTSSTMDEVWGRSADEDEGLVVVADVQTAGRGRHGRTWASRAARDLLFSVLLRPRPAFAHELLMMAALACAAVTLRSTGRECRIKWPNDVTVDGRKVAGVLAESRQQQGGLVAVLGIGLNVNSDLRRSDEAPNATSLSELTGSEHSRRVVLGDLLSAMDEMYAALRSGATLVPEWRSTLTTIGQRVAVSSADPRAPGLVVEGTARDVDEQGRLLVEDDDGLIHAVAAGEVTLRQPTKP